MPFLFTNIAYAGNTESLDLFLGNINKLILNPLIGLLFALAMLFFFYGVFQFISNDSDSEKKSTGKMHMLWGIVGITIMMGVWTILNIVLGTIGVDGIDPEKGKVELNDYNPNIPKIGK